jgi:hypothetical protein
MEYRLPKLVAFLLRYGKKNNLCPNPLKVKWKGKCSQKGALPNKENSSDFD